ncbi:GTPase Era [Haploplasma axanthum]|uniref:GTPase Era n=1 Tax=Haploplasma axanthum TaxID=29552 RepID=A0A449BEW7_HAPAX|nr:GTPase Era [Haploplasma axanthum]VEU81003.1 GTP-binding protein [Haploplasma axanthum]
MNNNTKSGFVAIVGRPNVGKSTLLNTLLKEKIAITSPKPQTTRHRISGILTKDNYQIVFVDTPGMHKGKDLLNKRIDKVAVSTLKDVDSIIFVVDRKKGLAEEHVINYFKGLNIPVYLVINKIDLMKNKSEIDEFIISYLGSYEFAGVYPISAANDENIEFLLNDVVKSLSDGPFYYPVEMKTDQTNEKIMSEFIREKILYYTEEEVPHATAVVIESMDYNEEYKTVDVRALIIVERTSQKIILIGKNGEKIKQIGTEARLDINKKFGFKAHLELWIKVKKDWRNRPNELLRYGFDNE